MVPFYGQGLNCGLEDVRILASLMVSHGLDQSVPINEHGAGVQPEETAMAAVLEEYTKTRHVDLVAICDLAMQN